MAAKKKKAAKKKATAMNKADLIDQMLKAKGVFDTKAQAERSLEVMLECIKKGLKKHKSVRLINFGTFEVRSRKRRKGRNPQTKKEIIIPASKTVAFRVGKQLKDFVN